MPVLPHWASFKQNLLPMLHMPGLPPATELWEQTLEQYKHPCFYEFQDTPFARFANTYADLLEFTGGNRQLAMQQRRVLTEEAYAVATFQQQQCRIIKPSSAIVAELRQTDARFKLREVIPPWPHVYIEMPQDSGMQMGDFYVPGLLRSILGVYVTWCETGSASRQAKVDFERTGEMRMASGEVVKTSEFNPDAIFGDWACRFLVVTRDTTSNRIHEFTVKYFNMHWHNENTDDIDQAYQNAAKIWGRTSGGLDAVGGGFDLCEEIFRLTVNLYMYMALPPEARDVVWRPNEDRERLRNHGSSWNSKRKRNLKNRLRDEMVTEEWDVGQTIVVQRSELREGEELEGGEPGEHRSPRTHWRRGHIRHVWLGARDKPEERRQELRYIRPCLVMGRGEAPVTTTVIVK